MNYPFFDYKTFFLYALVGTLCLWSMKLARGKRLYNEQKSQIGFICLFFTLLLFASLRKVGLHLGGEDALRYQEGFINYFSNGSARYDHTDILFGYLTGGIRLLTDNPIVYRFICYSIIAFGYVVYLKRFTPQGICAIPFVCILIPFMKSFGSMRNSISIALFLICIIFFYEKKYWWSFALFTCAALIHRLTFAMLSFFLIYYIIDNYILNKPKKTIFWIIIMGILGSYLVAVQLQRFSFILAAVSSDGNADFAYMMKEKGGNILLRWPMYIVHLFLFVALYLCYDKIPKTLKNKFLIIVFFFDVIILPATLVLNLWRFQEYFYISNLILWGIVIDRLLRRFNQYSTFVSKTVICIFFYGLMLIRLSREWQDLAIMPYLFIWQ